MKHVSSVMKESVWVDDRDISDCQHCKTGFSVARRKVSLSPLPVCLSVCLLSLAYTLRLPDLTRLTLSLPPSTTAGTVEECSVTRAQTTLCSWPPAQSPSESATLATPCSWREPAPDHTHLTTVLHSTSSPEDTECDIILSNVCHKNHFLLSDKQTHHKLYSCA